MRLVLLLTCALSGVLPCFAGGEAGRPLMSEFSPRRLNRPDRPVGPQFFSGLIDDQGRVFIAHNYGVSGFDGARWRTWRNDLQSPILSIALDGERILAAGGGTIGYFEPRGDGDYEYQSLIPRLPGSGPYGDFWFAGLTSEGPIFRSLPLIVLLQADGSVRSFHSDEGFHISAVIDGRFVMRERGAGLKTLRDGELVMMPNGEAFEKIPVYVYLRFDGQRLLLLARDGRGFLYDPDTGVYEPWQTDPGSRQWWERGEIYCGATLPDGRFVFGTIDRGIAVTDRDGRLLSTLDRQRGLRENLVFSLLVESGGDVWALLNDGATRIGLGNDLTHFGHDQGIEGFVESLIRHDGLLYAAASGGVVRLYPVEDIGTESKWLPVAGSTPQPWCFLEHRGELLLGGNSGLFRLVDGRFEPITMSIDVTSFCRDPFEPERWFLTGTRGISRLRYGDRGWEVSEPIPDLPDISPGGTVASPGELWLGTEQQRATKAVFESGADLPILVSRYGEEAGLPKGHSAAFALNEGEGWVLATDRGFYRFDETTQVFLPDPRFGEMTGSVLRMWLRQDGSLRAELDDRLILARPDETGRYWPHNDLLGLLPPGGRVLGYLEEGDTEWVCTDDGLFRWRHAGMPRIEGAGRPFLVEVLKMNGAQSARLAFPLERDGIIQLRDPFPSDVAGLRFSFALPDYRDTSRNEYRSRVEGLEQAFGPWSTNAERELGGLRHGDYKLVVEARNVLAEVGPPLEVEFRVLPPWYLTPLAGLAFLAAAGLLAYGFVRWRHRKIVAHNRLLARLVDEKTQELVRASYTDPLTGLHNRRYFEKAARLAVESSQAPGTPKGTRRKVANEVAVLLIDLDYFKKINDQYGHAAGDAVLTEVARRLTQATRQEDHRIRWGGEEFLILACGIDSEQADALTARILDLVAKEPVSVDGIDKKVTCSVGWTIGPWRQDKEVLLDLDELIGIADKALFLAKHHGRNRAIGALPGPQPQRLAGDPAWKLMEPENWPDGSVLICERPGPV